MNVDSVDQRRLQRYYVGSLATAPDRIALGSSRAMFIRHGMTADKSFFNHAVFGATLEDFVAILGLYDSREMLPKHVVLTIDPWIMNRLADPPWWQSLRDAYEHLATSASITIDHAPSALYSGELMARKAIELFSLPYFQACLRQLLYEPNRRFGPVPPAAVDDDMPGDVSKIWPDGSLQYPQSRYDQTPAETRLKIRRREQGMDSLGSFKDIDEDLKRALNRLVDYLVDRGIDVTLVLMPYHPLVYERMTSWPGYSVATSVEEYVRTMAADAHVRYVGSYDPALVGCDASEFFDETHSTPSCASKTLAPLRFGDREQSMQPPGALDFGRSIERPAPPEQSRP